MNEKRLLAALRRVLYEHGAAVEQAGTGYTVLDADRNTVAFFWPRHVSAALRHGEDYNAGRLDVQGLNAALRAVALERCKKNPRPPTSVKEAIRKLDAAMHQSRIRFESYSRAERRAFGKIARGYVDGSRT